MKRMKLCYFDNRINMFFEGSRCLRFVFFALFFFGLLLNSKSQNEQVSKEQRFQFGINLSPDFTYRALYVMPGAPNGIFLTESRNQMESPKLGVTLGVNMLYQLNQNWSLETGAQYSNKGYSFEITGFTYKDEEDDMLEKIYGVINHNFIEIPLKVNYYAGKKDYRFFVGSGIVTNVYVNSNEQRVEQYQNSVKAKSFEIDEKLRRYNFSFLLSAGMDFKVSPTQNFRLEPTFRYALMSISQTNQEHLYNIGFNIGYFFQF